MPFFHPTPMPYKLIEDDIEMELDTSVDWQANILGGIIEFGTLNQSACVRNVSGWHGWHGWH